MREDKHIMTVSKTVSKPAKPWERIVHMYVLECHEATNTMAPFK